MLRQLSITNYALIDNIRVEFQPGFTAITGETGSGKSILMDALGLALGNRAEGKIFRDAESKCFVEAIFEIENPELKEFFSANDLDFEPQAVLRREINASGKSRAFINDTPVQLQVLKELGWQLIDIHSQHENALVAERIFQFGCVDALAENEKQRQEYKSVYDNYKLACSHLEKLLADETALKRDLDYSRFQLNELEKLKPENLSPEALESELETLTNAESIRIALHEVLTQLEGHEYGALPNVARAKSALSKIASFNSTLGSLLGRLENVQVEIRDIHREAEQLAETITFDQNRIDEINEQLHHIQHLLKKHALRDMAELLALRNELKEKIDLAENFDVLITNAQNQIRGLKSTLEKMAAAISRSRQKAIPELQSEVENCFYELGLQHARLKIDISRSAELHVLGNDEIEFLFAANKGAPLQPVKDVASGGEMSRVMLALKAAVSKYRKLPAIILDEIDQGVSGEVAKKVGTVMHTMSKKLQVIAITHLPQIAGKAEHHFRVFKTSGKNSTTTHMEELAGENRVNELAEMLGGKALSQANKESARELMQ